MKIKLDENIPASLATTLRNLQHEVHTVADEELGGSSDRTIWEAAQRQERFLITQDLDFSDVRQFLPGTHHGILLLRLRDPSRQSLVFRTRQIFEQEQVTDWTACFVVATEHKIRIVRPES